MTVSRRVNAVSFEAAGDLSAGQFHIVVQQDDGRVALDAGNGSALLGVLLNKPTAAGQGARVAIDGAIVKCRATATIAERDLVTAHAVAGRASAITTAGANVVGIAVSPAAAGEYFELLINPRQV